MTKTIQQLLKEAPRIRVRHRETPPHRVLIPFEWMEYLLTIDPFEAVKMLVWLRDAGLYGYDWEANMGEIGRLVVPRMNLDRLEMEHGTLESAMAKAVETNKQDLS